jgi:hypothetical protein
VRNIGLTLWEEYRLSLLEENIRTYSYYRRKAKESSNDRGAGAGCGPPLMLTIEDVTRKLRYYFEYL